MIKISSSVKNIRLKYIFILFYIKDWTCQINMFINIVFFYPELVSKRARHYMVKYVVHFLRFSNEIDISRDRFSNGKHGGKEHASSVKKDALSLKNSEKEVSYKNFELKI